VEDPEVVVEDSGASLVDSDAMLEDDEKPIGSDVVIPLIDSVVF